MDHIISKGLPQTDRRGAVSMRRGERGIWPRLYWEHLIRDARDFNAHLDCVHINPVKHGWVKSVADCPYSTFHKLVEQGVYPKDWVGGDEGMVDVVD